MSEKVYRLETGQCTCVLGDPVLGSQRVPVLKLGGAAVVIASSLPLQKNQFVYTSVNLEGGPALALSGVVVSSNAEGVLIRWTHHDPAEGRRVEQAIREHLRKAGRSPSEVEEEVNLPAEPPRPAPVKGARPPTESRAPGRSPPPGKPPEKPPERGGEAPRAALAAPGEEGPPREAPASPGEAGGAPREGGRTPPARGPAPRIARAAPREGGGSP